MGDRDPLVSVIIPTFNREGYLREAIDSVFAQTYANWELIVADDGSTDGTRAYLATLDRRRVRVVACDRAGSPGRMRNIALRVALGAYVAFLDDDDLWMPQKLTLQVADLLSKPECAWSYTYFAQVGEHGEEVPLRPGQRPESCAGWILEPLVDGQAWVAPSAVLAARNLLDAVGGFDETLTASQDYDTFLKMSVRSQVSLLPAYLSAHRIHPGNTWKRLPASEIAAGQLLVYSRLLALRIPESARRACEGQCAAARIRLANAYRSESQYRKALGALVDAARLGGAHAAWWLALVKTCLRPFMPPAAMRLYRALRSP
jgi:glycosyltransferase involved in cell wall biosynthesis